MSTQKHKKGVRKSSWYALICPNGVTIENIKIFLDDGYFLTSLEDEKAVFVKNPQHSVPLSKKK